MLKWMLRIVACIILAGIFLGGCLFLFVYTDPSSWHEPAVETSELPDNLPVRPTPVVTATRHVAMTQPDNPVGAIPLPVPTATSQTAPPDTSWGGFGRPWSGTIEVSVVHEGKKWTHKTLNPAWQDYMEYHARLDNDDPMAVFVLPEEEYELFIPVYSPAGTYSVFVKRELLMTEDAIAPHELSSKKWVPVE